MKSFRKMGAVVAAVALASACGAVAEAALVVDVRVTGVTGAGATFTSKSASIPEGGTVTVTAYLQNLSTESLGGNGLGQFGISFRSFGETYNNGTPLSSPTVATTVLNATSWGLNPSLPANFNSPAPTDSVVLTDINAAISNPDPNDTDTDAWKISMSQVGPNYTVGFGLTEVELAHATFSAVDLVDGTYPFNRGANLNVYYTNSTGLNGGLYIAGLMTNGTTGNTLTSNLVTGASNVGTNVAVTVVPVPEPASLGLLALGALGLLRRRR